MNSGSYWEIPTDKHGGVLRTVSNVEQVRRWWPSDTKWQLELQLRSAVRHSSVWFLFYNAMDKEQNFPLA